MRIRSKNLLILLGILVFLLAMLPGAGISEANGQLTDEYVVNSEGSIISRKHYEYNAAGKLLKTTEKTYSEEYVKEYDESGNCLKNSEYEDGSLRATWEYTYNAAGRQTCEHYVTYSAGSMASETYEYRDYDASGRQIKTRYIDYKGAESTRELFEYNGDGSYVKKSYGSLGIYTNELAGETWYDSRGRQTRTVSYLNGIVYHEQAYEYIMNEAGKLIRKNTSTNGQATSIDKYEYDAQGHMIRHEEINEGFDYHVAHDDEYSLLGKRTASTCSYYDPQGNVTFRFIEWEGEYDASGRMICARDYRASMDQGTCSPDKTTYYVYQDRTGVTTPVRGTQNIYAIDLDDLLVNFRDLTRTEVSTIYNVRQISECVYDTDATVIYYDFPGTLRFVFGRHGSDRLLRVYWYCEDYPDDMLNEQSVVMEDAGFDFRYSNESGPNPAGFYEERGSCNSLDHFVLAYNSDEAGDGTLPVYISVSYDIRESCDPSVQDIQRTSSPVTAPTAAPQATPSAGRPDYSDAWVHRWVRVGEPETVLDITRNGDGSLHMDMTFYRMLGTEADFLPNDDEIIDFETEDGALGGILAIETYVDGLLHLYMNSGSEMEDEENLFYEYFNSGSFIFTVDDAGDIGQYHGGDDPLLPDDPEETDEPEATPVPTPKPTARPVRTQAVRRVTPAPNPSAVAGTGWTGHWAMMGGDYESHLYITQSRSDSYEMYIMFDGMYSFSGPLNPIDATTMDFYTDDFNGMLTLSRDGKTLLLSEIGSMVDEVNDWLDIFHFQVEYQKVSAGASRPVQLPTEKAPDRTGGTKQDNAGLLPIPGKQGYMQVPVSQADATSWIENRNDATAYMPFRMIDGDETTSYQFSTKKTKPGNAYLYFYFDSPVTLDELWIKNGFWRYTDGQDQYTRNCRIKTMAVDFLYEGRNVYRDTRTVNLKDDKSRKDWTAVELGRKTDVTAVRIRITAVYTGTKYKNDVCVSEVMFVQAK